MAVSVTRKMIKGNRFYDVGGALYPSVTTVLSVISKKFVSRWEMGIALSRFSARIQERLREGTAQRISREDLDAWTEEALNAPSAALGAAAGFGTRAHEVFDTLNKLHGDEAEAKSLQSVPADLKQVVENFIDFRASCAGLEFVENEMVVYSHEHQYAGAVDAVARFDGKIIVMDWKTGNQIHQEYALQVAAYAKAYEEMHPGQKVNQGWIVRFDKQKKKAAQVRIIDDIDETFEAFIAARKLWGQLQSFATAKQKT